MTRRTAALAATPAAPTRRAGRTRRAGLLAALALSGVLALGACADPTGPSCGPTSAASPNVGCETVNLGGRHF